MTKQEKVLSATAMMRQEIPNILKERYKDGSTFEELWNALYEDKELAKVMKNKENKPRYGLLQGLTNRIKDNKEENIALIKKEDGKNYYIYFNNSTEKLVKLTGNYLSSIEHIDTSQDTTLNKSKEKLLKEQQDLIEQLIKINNKLAKVVS